MSVPKSKQTIPKPELKVLSEARKLQAAIYDWVLRDFGYNKYPKFVKVLEKDLAEFVEMFPESTNSFEVKPNKNISIEYPDWCIERNRSRLLHYIDSVLDLIVIANHIYPTSNDEFKLRRGYQDKLICYLFVIKELFQDIIHYMPGLANRYGNIDKLLDRVISLAKSWRRSDTKRGIVESKEVLSSLDEALK